MDGETDRGEWSVRTTAGVRIVRCAALERVPGISHAFSTTPSDLGPADAVAPEILASRTAFLRAADLPGSAPFVLRQMHSAGVVRADRSPSPPVADAVVWVDGDPEEFVPSVRTADCVPLLLAVDDGRAVAAVHAGWRGTAAGVVEAAVERLAAWANALPQRLVAALGPAIGPCCYEVGPEVLEALRSTAPPAPTGGFLLDLPAEVAARLERAGVPTSRISRAPWCTRCRPDLFFSYRREGSAAGRLMASIGRWRGSSRSGRLP